MKTILKIRTEEIRRFLGQPIPEFPKYITQIINLANQNAQGTRPVVVGQLSELIQKFDGSTIEEWQEWYLERYPDALKQAMDRIENMIGKLKEAMNTIDRPMIERWVEDLLFVKTYVGLKFQQAILDKIARELNTSYRLSEPADETKGIDGYLGELPVSIKPETYKSKRNLAESIDVAIIYYQKVKDGIRCDLSEILPYFKER